MKKLIVLLLLTVTILQLKDDRFIYSINEYWDFKKEKAFVWEKVDQPHTWNTSDVDNEEKGYYQGWYSGNFADFDTSLELIHSKLPDKALTAIPFEKKI